MTDLSTQRRDTYLRAFESILAEEQVYADIAFIRGGSTPDRDPGSSFCVSNASFIQLRLEGVDVVGCHLSVGRHFAVDDLPQPERAGDVAVFVEGHRADDPLIADRLAVFD